MIELGLGRISKLLEHTPLTWKAIHVAGTNGKGSICAYTSALLKESSVRCGRFTSPHLIIPRDCISINEQTVAKSLFDHHYKRVATRDRDLQIRASEFELLTATAFEIFNDQNVELGVVEVGLGGRLDATNVMNNVIVSVISKIGLDHQALLGNSIAEIAEEKAGILRQAAPVIVDGTNSPDVTDTIHRHATHVGTSVHFVRTADTFERSSQLATIAEKLKLLPHQQVNLCCAVEAFTKALDLSQRDVDLDKVLPVIETVSWPGRLQHINLELENVPLRDILLDGAHNAQSARVLGNYVDSRVRIPGAGVIWVVGVSRGKDIMDILSLMCRSGDDIIAVPFGPVEDMPWVKCMEPGSILQTANEIGWFRRAGAEKGILQGLQRAAHLSTSEGMGTSAPVVVAGSLYLVSDFLRLLLDHNSVA